MNRILKTDVDYQDAVARLHELLAHELEPDSDLSSELELLALLISTYERERFEHLPAPLPIDAIRFRMDQLGLTQKELVPYLGSPSRVSEILSGKRSLTLPMIRALVSGLGIPAEVLISENQPTEEPEPVDLDWDLFPVDEMVRRGWLTAAASRQPGALRELISPVLQHVTAFRRTSHFQGPRTVDSYALLAWLARIWQRADDMHLESLGLDLTTDLVKDVVRLSWSAQGPRLALELLKQHGVIVVIEPQLPKTYLDAVTIFGPRAPIIGMTLRFDRLDSFWYTLVHELAHILLHRGKAVFFFDDFEAGMTDDLEREADEFATTTLIPDQAWKSSPASRLKSRQAAEHLARQLRVSPAIVAGRIRREYNDYRVLNDLVGHHAVRRLFPEVNWT